MADLVLVPLPDGRWIALDAKAYQIALAEGSRFCAAPEGCSAVRDEPLLDGEQLAATLGVPVTWIEQKAREGVIPSLEFGRWRRFRRSEVEAAVREHRQSASPSARGAA